MRQKIEIKVYLPYMMVGELESKKRAGKRSKFIEEAVRNRLDEEASFTINDIPTRQIMAALQQRDDCPKHIKIVLWDQLVGEGLE